MSIRTASLLVSLLVHGTAFYYLQSLALSDRWAPTASGRSMTLALVRTESRRPVVMTPVASESVILPKLKPSKALSASTSASGASPAQPRPVRAVQRVLTRQALTETRQVKTSPPSVSSVPRQTPSVWQHAEPPVPKPMISPPRPRDEPAAPSNNKTREPQAIGASSMPSAETLRGIEQTYINALAAAIERHKRYPLRARKKGYEGEVQVQFTVLKDGTISRVVIGSSSRRSILDRAASQAVLDLGRFQPIPPQLRRDHWEFQVPIRFAMD